MERDEVILHGIEQGDRERIVGVLRIADSSGVDDQHGTIVRRSVSVANR